MPSKPTRLFISHTHSDAELAHAINDLIRAVFGDKVEVVYSTSKEVGSGPAPGRDWFKWITTQVRESRSAIVILTPASVQKPWVLWEAGAVFGAALGQEAEATVLPVTYQLKTSEIPSPIEKQRIQAVEGDKRVEMRDLMNQFISHDFEEVFSKADVVKAITRLDKGLKEYEAKVQKALLRMPVMPTEASIQEWLTRIEELKDQNRLSEVNQRHQWLDVAFGRDPEDASPRPLDLRIHRKLGDLYLGAKDFKHAIEQFELARRLAPRDLFVMRLLGQALVEEKEYEKAREILDAMQTLDIKIFERNAECAALKGRWHVENGDLSSARDIYKNALSYNRKSYYLADLLGQVQLALGEHVDAKQTYERVQSILEEVGARNIWTLATAATAKIVQEKETEALKDLKAIRKEKPTEANLNSIERGLRRLCKSLEIGDDHFEEWRKALRV